MRPPSTAELQSAQNQVRLHPASVQGLLSLGILYHRAGRLKEAAASLLQAARLAPTDPQPQRELAAVFDAAGYLDREIDALKTAVNLDSGDWRSRLQLVGLYGRLGWFDRAFPLLRDAVALAPDQPGPYLGEATAAYQLGRFRDMESWDERGLKVAPRDAALHASCAEALRLNQKLPAAEQELRRAIRFSGSNVARSRDYRDLAHLFLDPAWPQPRYSEAAQAARTALRLDPDDWQAHYWLGRALQYLGKEAESDTEYRATGDHALEFEAVSYQLGMIDRKSPDPKQQAEGARLAQFYSDIRSRQRKYDDDLASLTNHPQDPKAHAVMVTWYLAQRRFPEAIVELKRILELAPNDDVARRLLIRTLRAAGRITEARELSAAVSRAPTPPPAGAPAP